MKRIFATSLALCLSGALPATAGDEIKVLTQNQALGADFASLLAPPNGDFNGALVSIIKQVAATDFPARAQRQALQIARRKPHLVGLQEVWELRCRDLNSADNLGCEDPDIAGAFVDYLDETLAALVALGAEYETIAVVHNLDLSSIQIGPFPGLPFVINGTPAFLVAIDRDVILARRDVMAVAADLGCGAPPEDGCNYQFVLPVNLPGINLTFPRGFVAADATVGSRSYRFVNTHLEIREEPVPREFQCEQAAELIETLGDTPEGFSLIVVGDLNSSPEDVPFESDLPLPLLRCDPDEIIPPYIQFVEAGYTDVWTLRPGRNPGFTCCQAADLSNRRSTLSERIDMIFSFDLPRRVKRARVVGDRVAEKTRPPGPRLWPSDHGGVVATLRLEDLFASW